MKKYRVSRWKQLIFPKELLIDKYHVLSRKRHFPAFWIVKEESIPLSKIASIQIHRGLLFSKIIVENSGGPFPIIVNGLWNKNATEARDILEMIEREMQKGRDIIGLIDEGDDDGDGDIPDDRGPSSFDRPDGEEPDWEEDRTNTHRAERTRPESNYDIDLTDRKLPSEEILAAEREPVTDTEEPGEWPAVEKVPHIVAYNRTHPAEDRRVGEVPDSWNPAPPWAPVEKKTVDETEEDGYAEVDAVEFLKRQSEPSVTVTNEAGAVKKQSPVNKLVNWWNEAKSEVMSGGSRPKRRRRNLR